MKTFNSTVTYELKDKGAIEIKATLSYRIPRVLGDEIVNQVEQKINKVLVPDKKGEGCAQGSFTVFRSDISSILYIKGFKFWVWIDDTTTYEKMMSVVECVRTFFAELAAQHQFLYEFVKLNDEREVENDRL